ncbi:MAG: insulinase family protein, partial [Acidobacteria bacterium]|nr:insulinase family protein [Acidobacteriota bacterium]
MSENHQFVSRTFRRVLPNGITLLVLENPANPTVEIRGAVRAGLFFETFPPYGVSRFTASMLMRGSRRHSKLELARRLEDVGADLDTSGGRFLVNISGRCLRKDLSLLLETAAEVLQEPVFPEEEVERLRIQVVGSLRRSQEDTSVRAYDRLSQLIYPESNPFFRPAAADRIAAVESIKRIDLEGFHRSAYGARSLILAIVGDVRAEDCNRWVEERFGSMEAGPDKPIDVPRTQPRIPATGEWVEMADKSSVDVLLGHAGQLRRTDPPFYAAMLGNAALGQSTLSSRLGRRVRDQEGLSYGIVSRFFEATYADGPWGISVTVNPE